MSKNDSTLTAQRLRELLNYDQKTGIFTWRINRGLNKTKNKIAGHKGKNGYSRIEIDSARYLSHRLAWLYITGTFPDNDIDHINCDRNDNRFENLRIATPSQNQSNRGKPITNTSGFKGVTWSKKCNKWQASIKHAGKNLHIGVFISAEEASHAYINFSKKIKGSFFRYE